MAQPIRFRSLDALRGLSILGMAWSGMLPDSLPAWMYHIQTPPPNHDYHPEIFGLSWVDLVFPFFLFSMGAAIPIAISNRLNRGEKPMQIVGWLIGRGLLLAAFSLIGEHLRPGEWGVTNPVTAGMVGIGGFCLLVLMYARWPKWMPVRVARSLNFLSWIVAIGMIVVHVYPDGNRGFENSRNDIILMVLANVAVSAGIIWLVSRCRPFVRIGLIGALILVFLGQSSSGSVASQIWNFTPLQFIDLEHWKYSRFFPILYHFEYHKYLLIVLPGTFCGDLILQAGTESEGRRWEAWRTGLIIILGLSVIAECVIGLTNRQPLSVFWTSAAGCAILIYLSRGMDGSIQSLIARMIRFGTGFLLIGLIAEPIGGGIRKDSPTLSYFLVASGLAFLLIAVFEIVIDLYKERRISKFLWLTGMNPILAYAAITNFVMGLNIIFGYSDRLGGGALAANPWLLAVWDGGMRTLLVGITASVFTQAKIFLRA